MKLDTENKYVKYGLIAGGLFVGYKLIQFFTGSSNSINAASNEIKVLNAKGVKATYPDSNYTQWASAIVSAGFNTLGTNEDAIYAIFKKMVNDLDVAKLIVAFGNQRVEFSFQKMPLGAWLSSELDSNELEIVNKILRDRNIKYQF
jgi:hypothetical protein